MKPSRDQYWRWKTYESNKTAELRNKLTERGYHATQSMNREGLIEQAYQMDTQRPEYRNCDLKELRRFVQNRALLLPSAARRTGKTSRIALLKAADHTRTFNRFENLPPELRVRVYNYYFADFTSTLKAPAQPPLARLSKTMRAEVLPVFFQRFKFEVHLKLLPVTKGRTKSVLKISRDALAFLSAVPETYFSDIRRMTITIGAYTGKKKAAVWAAFDINTLGLSSVIEVTSLRPCDTSALLHSFGPCALRSNRSAQNALQKKIVADLYTELNVEEAEKQLSLSRIRKARERMEQSFTEAASASDLVR